MPKVVKRKKDGAIVYRSDPEFPPNLGIINAAILKGGSPDDYEEVDITEQEWTDSLKRPEPQATPTPTKPGVWQRIKDKFTKKGL